MSDADPASTATPASVARGVPADHISAVSETLFLPLYALALGSQLPDPIIVDEGAVELTRRLNERFAASEVKLHRRLAAGKLPKTLLTSMGLRIRQYDRFVTTFIEHEPDAIVVNLGCGLDDRRRRVDDGRVRWFDLDLPEVIALRRSLLPETERMSFIASSVLDFSWMDQLPVEPGHRFLFVAEGLFMYLQPTDVRFLVLELMKRFPGAELVAEVANSRIVRMMQKEPGRSKLRRQFGLSENVVYHFGLSNSHDMEEWAKGLTFLGEGTYFDEPDPQLGWLRWFAGWPLFRWAQWTVRYHLGVGPRR